MTITMTFEDLKPSVYSDLHAVLNGQDTASAASLRTSQYRAAGQLNLVAMLVGMNATQVFELINADGCDGDNYEALGAAIEKRIADMKADSVAQKRGPLLEALQQGVPETVGYGGVGLTVFADGWMAAMDSVYRQCVALGLILDLAKAPA